ncbi:ribosomal protein S18 [Xylariaceae sp. FL1651]|nr:ribosomal protein S18 [Xylariaceae sp. FL1651]
MPPRIPILSALRQGIALAKTPFSPLSTTAVSQALRKDLPRSSSTSGLLDLDTSSSKSFASADPTTMAKELHASMRGARGRGSRGSPIARRAIEKDIARTNSQDDHLRQLPRRWRAGDVYAPHDLSPSEMAKWRRNTRRQKDVVDLLGLRPLDMYWNFSVISEFVTPHGRIRRAVDTGLSPVNQRKMAKAVRRSIGLGLHPSVHRHPELLMREPDRVLTQNIATVDKKLKWA